MKAGAYFSCKEIGSFYFYANEVAWMNAQSKFRDPLEKKMIYGFFVSEEQS